MRAFTAPKTPLLRYDRFNLLPAFWVGGFVIAGLGFQQGSPLTLIFGLDYQGGVCNKMVRRRFAYLSRALWP